jgi:hypothetical protein
LGPGDHAHAQISFDEPAERTAPGQIACLYAGDVVVGHATIDSHPPGASPPAAPPSARRGQREQPTVARAPVAPAAAT